MKIKDIYKNICLCDYIQEFQIKQDELIHHTDFDWDDNFLYLEPRSFESQPVESKRTIISMEEEVEIDDFILTTKNIHGETIKLYCFVAVPITTEFGPNFKWNN